MDLSSKKSNTEKIWFRYGFENLLIWLFLYLVVSPFIEGIPFIKAVINILFGAVLLFAVIAMNKKSRMLTPAIILLGLTLTLYCLEILEVISFSLEGFLVTKTLYSVLPHPCLFIYQIYFFT